MIKLSDYEKNEAKRKLKEENKQREFTQEEGIQDSQEEIKKLDNRNEIDYNALDYEDNEDHQSDDENISKKQVPSLVQYPLPGSFKPIDGPKENTNKETHNVDGKLDEPQNTKRSEVLAMALGVQIKTGEDPPTGEIEISGYNKKKKIDQFDNNLTDKNNEVNSRLLKIAGQPENPNREFNEDQTRGERNKFKIEKMEGRFYDKFRNGRNRELDRRRDYGRTDYRRDIRRRYEFGRYRRNSRYRSPRRSRSRDRRKSRSRDRSRRSHSKEKRNRNVSKSRSPDQRKRKQSESSDKGKEPSKKSETDVEKFKRRAEQILLLKKKMEFELLEMKKKKEEEEKQVI